MERLFRSLKSEWLPAMGYMNLREAKWDNRQQKPKNGLTKCPDLVDHYIATPWNRSIHSFNRW